MSSYGIAWPDAPTGGPWHFAGVPGVYARGEAMPLEATGRSKDEMQAIIDAAGVPLEIVEIGPPAEASTEEV